MIEGVKFMVLVRDGHVIMVGGSKQGTSEDKLDANSAKELGRRLMIAAERVSCETESAPT